MTFRVALLTAALVLAGSDAMAAGTVSRHAYNDPISKKLWAKELAVTARDSRAALRHSVIVNTDFVDVQGNRITLSVLHNSDWCGVAACQAKYFVNGVDKAGPFEVCPDKDQVTLTDDGRGVIACDITIIPGEKEAPGQKNIFDIPKP